MKERTKRNEKKKRKRRGGKTVCVREKEIKKKKEKKKNKGTYNPGIFKRYHVINVHIRRRRPCCAVVRAQPSPRSGGAGRVNNDASAVTLKHILSVDIYILSVRSANLPWCIMRLGTVLPGVASSADSVPVDEQRTVVG
jgi:hypothetical protein